MTRAIPNFDTPDDAAAISAALAEHGAVIVHNFLRAPVLAAFNAEVDELVEREAGERRGFPNQQIAEFFGDKVNHLAGLAGKSRNFCEHVLCHPAYMAVCDAFLKPNCSDYQLNIAHLMERAPGSEAQLIHRDAWVWKRIPPGYGEIQVASLVALTDFTADNGGTLLVPGSHLWPEERYPATHEVVATEMPAGSAVIYLGNTFHGGGGNVTASEVRRGLHVSYTLGWLRTEENQCLATPLEVARNLPQRAQELLGFGVHDDIEVGGGYIGTVELEAAATRMANRQL